MSYSTIIQAFIGALAELDAPLPQEQQIKLNNIAKILDYNNQEEGLKKIVEFAEQYEPLNILYRAKSINLQNEARERNKCGDEINDSENKFAENIFNELKKISAAKDSRDSSQKRKQKTKIKWWQKIFRRSSQG